jgi:hypothetical protein
MQATSTPIPKLGTQVAAEQEPFQTQQAPDKQEVMPVQVGQEAQTVQVVPRPERQETAVQVVPPVRVRQAMVPWVAVAADKNVFPPAPNNKVRVHNAEHRSVRAKPMAPGDHRYAPTKVNAKSTNRAQRLAEIVEQKRGFVLPLVPGERLVPVPTRAYAHPPPARTALVAIIVRNKCAPIPVPGALVS